MKRTLLAAAVAITGVCSAHAADFAPQGAYTKAPMLEPVYNWTGLYVGLNAGDGYAQNDHTDNLGGWWTTLDGLPGATQRINADGAVYGGQIGFNWQAGRWVFGLEGQFSGADLKRTDASAFWPTVDSLSAKIDSYATVTGRIGYTFGAAGEWLPYIKGGYAGANLKTTNSDISDNRLDNSAWRSGYVIGAGFEYGITKNWTVGFEYNYMDFGGRNFDGVDTGVPGRRSVAGEPESFHDKLTISTVTARVNYKF